MCICVAYMLCTRAPTDVILVNGYTLSLASGFADNTDNLLLVHL